MTDPQAVGWSFLRSRRWFGYLAMLVLFSLACVWFGNWQFDRRAEARAEIARIDANYDAPAVPLTDALAGLSDFTEDELKWQTVVATGTYVGEPFLARNRPAAEGVGSNLIMPLQLADGSVFFVDRGWVPVSGADEIPANLPAAPTGTVTVEARLRASEPEIFGRSSSGRSVASINLPELSALLETERAYTGAYGQVVSETPAGDTGLLPAKPERDEGPHLSYALQWYIFILIAIVGVAYAARQEYRNLNAGDASVLREDARRAERKRRRGPTDADVEDALLDA
ncbi:SURF1 family cytochrome oxidase biogenesis protein [Leucobacter sp. W1153]|uniref:SURF1 family cytochrome oxidase biogenesis protein n=1 Tax=unclassified Leucobacter TaxID=2621730 RepID=UPI003F36C77A